MNIMMLTNTYKPLLGGLEKSVEHFTSELRDRGHRVVIVTPEFPDAVAEEDVIRIPAMQNFNDSDFSVQLPAPGALTDALGDFRPNIIHTHHPFLIGDTALRLATKYNVPLVFTHHTLYEENVHYVPGNEEKLKRFVIELSTGYANLADQIIAPSESVMNLIKERGVTTAVNVVPTGIYTDIFAKGSGKTLRKTFNIPSDAFVVGHLGRLAPEKNLEFLARAVAQFLKTESQAHFLIAGKGPSQEAVQAIFDREGLTDRLHWAGVVNGQDLVDTYHAMDVFVFASHSETQGLVLVEAMSAGVPVVGIDAPGVREVIKDTVNGRLLASDNADEFADALSWMKQRSPEEFKNIKNACKTTADEFSMQKSTEKLLSVYTPLVVEGFFRRKGIEESPWAATSRMIQTQWSLVKNLTKATGAYVKSSPEDADIKKEELSFQDVIHKIPDVK